MKHKQFQIHLTKIRALRTTRSGKEKQCIDTRVVLQTPHGPIMEVAQQSPEDTYHQLKGKQVAFGKLLEAMREDGFSVEDRKTVWRMGEVYMGLRSRGEV